VTAFVTLNPKDFRNKVIFTFLMGKFKPSNLGRDVILEKLCDAMNVSKYIEYTTNILAKQGSL